MIRRNLGADPENPIASMKAGQYGNVFLDEVATRCIAFTLK